jgi:hypothetical protein
MMCQDSILLGQERNKIRIIAESPVNLPVPVAVLPECELKKLHLIVRAILVAKSSGPLCPGGKHSLLVGWLVVGPGV